MEDKTQALKDRMNKVMEWRRIGNSFSQEQQIFADQLVDDMLHLKNMNKSGIQVISRANMDFIQKKTLEAKESDVASAPSIGESSAKTGKFPRKSPVAGSVGLDGIEGHAEGEVKEVADAKAESKSSEGKPEDKPSESIGHNPTEPIPKKTAEELLENARWGVEIGAYSSIEEAIDKQLSRKAYAEFVDSPEKLKAVKAHLSSIAKQ